MGETTKSQGPLPNESLDQSPVLKTGQQCTRRSFNQILFGMMALGSLPSIRGCDWNQTNLTTPKNSRKGSLLIAGGGQLSPKIHSRFVEMAGGKDAHIVVIPTADTNADRPDQPIEMYWNGPKDVSSAIILHTRSRVQANMKKFVEPLNTATGIWFSGGQQRRITDAYMGTRVQEELYNVLKRGGVIGGTSAGAAVLSRIMITGGDIIPTLDKGFGFIEFLTRHKCIIDQHFDTRDRIERLLHALKTHPEYIGLGIYEGAALVITGSEGTVLCNNVELCYSDGTFKEYAPGTTIDFNALLKTTN